MESLVKICPTVFDVPERYKDDPRKRIAPNWWALCKPRTREEVMAVLEFSRREGVKIVPFGGGTGLVTGQFYTGKERAICLSLENMHQIEIESGSVLVEAGAVLDNLHNALSGTGSHFPLHLASSGSAQIGGLIATNAGGINVIRWGSMGALVLGLEVVMADGTLIDTTRDLRKDNTGYQLDRLMIGSEGTLGIVTRARLKTFPLDPSRAVILGEVASPDAALRLLEIARALPAQLSAFELISGVGLDFRKRSGFSPCPIGEPDWSVIIEVGGVEASVEESIEALSAHFENAVLAQSEAQVDEIWQVRETIPEANRNIGAIASHDISLPIHLQSEFIAKMATLLAPFDLRVNVFGHLGDGNLHYNLFPQQNMKTTDYDAKSLSHLVHDQVTQLGGSISAEHGIGRYKARDMDIYNLGAKKALMKKLKLAIDPQEILNPGVFFEA